MLARGAHVLCLGAAFKAGVSDVRNSRAVRVMEILEHEGAHVEYCDPLVEQLTLGGVERTAVDLRGAAYGDYDLIVALVRNPAWPVDVVVGAGTPVFDAVDALGTPAGARHERL